MQISPVIQRMYQALHNPLTQNKSQKIKEIQQYFIGLVTDSPIPYFCNSCGFKHYRGKIFEEHRKFASYLFEFPEIHPFTGLRQIKSKVVGIYGMKSENYCASRPIPSRSRIRAVNYSSEIHVYLGKRHVGFLPRKVSPQIFPYFNQELYSINVQWIGFKKAKFREYNQVPLCMICRRQEQCSQHHQYLKNLMQGGCDYCYYDHEYGEPAWRYFFREYSHFRCDFRNDSIPSGFFSAPEGCVKIKILNKAELNHYLNGIIELAELGHPEILPPLMLLKDIALTQILCLFSQNNHPNVKKWVPALYKLLKVPVNTEYSIYL